MKKIFLLAIMAVMSWASQAQIVSSRSSMVTKEEAPKNGWSTFGFEYLPSSWKYSHDGYSHSDSFNAASILWTKATGLTSSTPLFLEWGLGLQYSWKSEDDVNTSVASVKIPLNLIYSYQIPETSISIDPYIGLNFRFNGWAKIKNDKNDTSINPFDKDDMGDSDLTWNRFQLGWHIGARARFSDSFFLGVAYGTDFSEISKYTHIEETTLSLGFVF